MLAVEGDHLPHLWEFQQKSFWTDLTGAGEVSLRSGTKCDIFSTKGLALLKLRICKAWLTALSLQQTYVDHLPCWLTEILPYGLIYVQMSHANFKVTKKDLELISWIKGTVRQPWPWGFSGSRSLVWSKSMYCQRGGYNFASFLTEPHLTLKRFSMVTVGFVDVEHNWTNQCIISLMNLFTSMLWKNFA